MKWKFDDAYQLLLYQCIPYKTHITRVCILKYLFSVKNSPHKSHKSNKKITYKKIILFEKGKMRLAFFAGVILLM